MANLVPADSLVKFVTTVPDLTEEDAKLLHAATFRTEAMVRAASKEELQHALEAGPGGLLYAHCHPAAGV